LIVLVVEASKPIMNNAVGRALDIQPVCFFWLPVALLWFQTKDRIL